MSNTREFVNYQIDDHIALVVIDRPPVNALNRQVETEIAEVFEELGTLNEAGAVIVTGGGEKAFIAGADIMRMSGKGVDEGYDMSEYMQRVLLNVERFNKIVIAAISGFALGGGSEVALACDIRIADESAHFGFPEVTLGLIPGAGGTQRLSRLIGTGKAKELITTGDIIDANEAKAIGLIERLVPKGEALPEAKKMAKRILQRGPIAVMNAKRAINEGLNTSFEEGLKIEAQLFSVLFATQDLKEGVSAFLEKRKPEFKGE